MSEETANSTGRELLFGLVKWAAGVFLFGACAIAAVWGGIVSSPNNYVVNSALRSAREIVVFSSMFGLGQTLAFAAGWLETTQERSYHPFVVGLATALTASVALTLLWDDDTAGMWLAAAAASLVVALVATRVRLPTTPPARRSWLLLGAGIISMIGWYILSPRKLDYPHDAVPDDRHEWAMATLGTPYASVDRWASSCPALDDWFGAPVAIAPARRGTLRITDVDGERRIEIDLAVRGSKASGTCELDAIATEAGIGKAPNDVVASCELPDETRVQIPRDCDCGACRWDCEDSAQVITPHVEVMPANVDHLLVSERLQICDDPDRRGPCDVTRYSGATNVKLVRLEDDDAVRVPTAVETLDTFGDVHRFDLQQPLRQGSVYRLTWNEDRCGAKSFEFAVGPPEPMEVDLRVEPLEGKNEIRVELVGADVWTDAIEFGLGMDGEPIWFDEPTELPCDEPGPRTVELKAATLYDEALALKTTYDYRCP